MRIEVKSNSRPEEVQVTVYTDGMIDYCSHTNQAIEYTTFNDGMDDEYGMSLAVCQKCGAGWDEDGEQRIEL